MSLFPPHIIGIVAHSAYQADKLTRSDLINGYIATENDYTSNFTGEFRREINASTLPNLFATSYLLAPRQERKLGADACFVFENTLTKEFKIGIFEAKWPRLSTHTNYWDRLQKSTQKSHFHDQMERQDSAPSEFAKWEMFYFEHTYRNQPNYLIYKGSACLWHADAYGFSLSRNPPYQIWTDQHLEGLLGSIHLNIWDIVSNVCDCKNGTAYNHGDYMSILQEFNAPNNILVVSYGQDNCLDQKT